MLPEQLQRNNAFAIEKTLFEQETPHGLIAVYQTAPYGMILMLNGKIVLSQNDSFFLHEMLVHPALYTHPKPEKVVIVGNFFGILQEVARHTDIREIHCVSDNALLNDAVNQYFAPYQVMQDNRIHYHAGGEAEWLNQLASESMDIIIQSELNDHANPQNFSDYYRVLRADGMLVQPCPVSLLEFKKIKPLFHPIQQAGFQDLQTLNFPQPSYSYGSRMIFLATKNPTFKRIREKDVFNRSFATRYYNLDTHKASLAVPEFLREELEIG